MKIFTVSFYSELDAGGMEVLQRIGGTERNYEKSYFIHLTKVPRKVIITLKH